MKPNFTEADINKMIADRIQRYEQAVVLRLQRIGEQFIADARINGQYTDRTGNLRSSIGYVILKNGEQLTSSGFVQIKKGLDGTKKGGQFLEQVSLKFPKGYVLIVVAGMSYAAYVEAKGKDALTSSSFKAEATFKKAIERINSKAA